MGFDGLLNRKVTVYVKAQTGAAVESWTQVETEVRCRIMPITATMFVTEGFGLSQTDAMHTRPNANLRGGRKVKVTHKMDSGSWTTVSDGDEYLILGRPVNVAGADHHYRTALALLEVES